MANSPKIIIVGGGFSGLVAASHLKNDYAVTLLDKGYGIGGRLASRSLKSGDEILGFFDYGMQYFSAEDPSFQDWVQGLIKQKVITEWAHNIQETTSNDLFPHPIYYRGVKSNRAIAEFLAKDLKVINQTRVERLEWRGANWQLHSIEGQTFDADAVLMTPPVPQALEILSRSKLDLSSEMRSRLERVAYAPCLSLMAVLDRPSLIPKPGGIQVNHSSLYWIASNRMKSISPEGYAVTLLATPQYSEHHWADEAEAVIADMLQAAQHWIKPESAIATRLHRWKYSYPTAVFGERSATVIEAPGPLIIGGDAFCECITSDISLHLEQSFLSGKDAARCLKEQLQF